MVTGMRAFTLAYPNGLRLASLDEFRRYCYYVAGTVGHLLTELWRVHSTAVNEHVYARLLVDCEAFGETLQTVNIIKDIAWDAERENAIYVPADLLAAAGSAQHQILSPQYRGANRVAIEPLLTLAKDDLERALEYICTIPPTAVRIRLFCALPMLFAAATLRELDQSDAMLVPGGGVKITRDEVRSIVFAASTSTLTNGSLRWLVRRIRRRPFLLGRR
jgi:farnesyl-diphosphate farnesyltransferase